MFFVQHKFLVFPPVKMVCVFLNFWHEHICSKRSIFGLMIDHRWKCWWPVLSQRAHFLFKLFIFASYFCYVLFHWKCFITFTVLVRLFSDKYVKIHIQPYKYFWLCIFFSICFGTTNSFNWDGMNVPSLSETHIYSKCRLIFLI